MKLTWFGGTTLRIHIGGRILLVDPAGISGVSDAELMSGADRVFGLRDVLPELQAGDWRPRRPAPLVKDQGSSAVEMHRIGPGAVLVDAVGEPPLVLAFGRVTTRARWTSEAAVVAFGSAADLPGIVASALDAMTPRLIALAATEEAVEAAISALGERVNGTGLLSLEPGLALEL